jgi:HlyD family secretion protein
MKHLIAYIIVCTFFFLSSCTKKKSPVITFELTRSDFIEKIYAPGTVQAVNTISIVAPRIPVSSVTVAHLIEDGSIVNKGDTICILSAPDLESRLESVSLNLETTMADMKKMEADNAMNLSMLEAQIDNNEAQVAMNSLDSIQQKFAPPLKQKLFDLELKKANVEKSKLQKRFSALKKISDSDLRKMRSRIMQSENMVKMYKDQIAMLTLVSPTNGMVMHVKSPIMMFMGSGGSGTIGGDIEEGSTVFSNMAILQIPDRKEMQVSVEVAEADYKRIEKGQKVKILVDAANKLITTGSIKKKTLMGQTAQVMSQYENQTKIKTYEVIVKVDSCHSLMTPGLSAHCDIIINSVNDTLVVPTAAIFQNDSTKTVYVSNGPRFSPVTVETGLSNSSETIISKGLYGGEVIALMKPSQNFIKKNVNKNKEKPAVPEQIKIDSLNNKVSKR